MELSGQIGQVERPPIYVNADIEEIEALARLEPDWDSYGAATISPQAIALAKDLVTYTAIGAASLGIEARPYYIGPTPIGGVHVEWRRDRREIQVDVRPNQTLGCLLVRQSDTKRERECREDVPLIGVLWLIADVINN
ncbi:MAG: hypothetical protein ACYDAR_01560 [Thermomicrobiales bacterium]